MLRTYKYRLYPNRYQREWLEIQLELHRRLYNAALEQRIRAYKKGQHVSCFDQALELRALKSECPEFTKTNHSAMQQTLRRLDKAYSAFFRRIKNGEKPGFPRFRAAPRYNTIEYAKHGNGCQVRGERLYLQHVGLVKVKWHRELPATPKTLSITRRNNKWCVNFIVGRQPENLPDTGRETGIDMGIGSLIATSGGEIIPAPKYFRRAEGGLKRASQMVSRRKRGSRRWRKAVNLLAKRHEHVANQRRDHAHKAARALVNKNDMIAVEKLDVAHMAREPYMGKPIYDAAWRLFLNILKGKAESAGRQVVEVAPEGTSEICSGCGTVVKKSRRTRIHRCSSCGLVVDRDVNAARNILSLARAEPSALAAMSAASPRSYSPKRAEWS